MNWVANGRRLIDRAAEWGQTAQLRRLSDKEVADKWPVERVCGGIRWRQVIRGNGWRGTVISIFIFS